MWKKLNGMHTTVLCFHTGKLIITDTIYFHVSQAYAQVVNSGWKLKCMYWRGRRFDLLNPDGLFGDIYRVSQEECAILRESVPYVKLYGYNPKHLYPKLNGYGDNGQRKVWTSCISVYCISTAVRPLTLKPHLPVDT